MLSSYQELKHILHSVFITIVLMFDLGEGGDFMRRLGFFRSLFFCVLAVNFSITRSHAQSGYLITERKLAYDENIQSNGLGWFAIYNRSSAVLYGPNGYQRDISKFIPPNATGTIMLGSMEVHTASSGYVYRISPDGDVYFGQVLQLPNERGVGILHHRLPVDSDRIEDVFAISTDWSDTSSEYLNLRGDRVSHAYSDGSLKLTVKRFKSGEETVRVYSFPPFPFSRRQKISTMHDTSGNFTLVRANKQYRSTKRLRLTGLCIGNSDSGSIQCMDQRQLRSFNKRGLMPYSLEAGTLIVSGGRKSFFKVNSQTFEVQRFFTIGEGITEPCFLQDGSTILFPENYGPEYFAGRPQKTTLVRWSADGKRSTMNCRVPNPALFDQAFRTVAQLLSFFQLEGDRFMLFGRDDTNGAQNSILLTFTPTDDPNALSQKMNVCVPK